MNILKPLSLIAIACCLSGCVWKSFGREVASIESCNEYDQSKINIEAVISTAEQLKIEGKLSSKEFIEIDQDAGLYSKRIKDLCNFFVHERITYEQYQLGMSKANEDYTKIRDLVFSKK